MGTSKTVFMFRFLMMSSYQIIWFMYVYVLTTYLNISKNPLFIHVYPSVLHHFSIISSQRTAAPMKRSAATSSLSSLSTSRLSSAAVTSVTWRILGHVWPVFHGFFCGISGGFSGGKCGNVMGGCHWLPSGKLT